MDKSNAPTRIEDLTGNEQLVFGGLIRLLVRTDGTFSEEEEDAINAIGDMLGGHEAMWRMISNSAQAYPDEGAIREVVGEITRPRVRAFVLASLRAIAAADSADDDEDDLIAWVDEQWSA